MEITSKLILSSAQNFIKNKELNKKELNKNVQIPDINKKEHYNFNNSKVLQIQEDLKSIQFEFTKEQVRFQYLKNSPEKITENLKFNNELLFPELIDNSFNKEDLIKKIEKNIENLKLKLKRLEIEQENIFAANFISPMDLKKEDLNIHLSKLKPERVTELTRNQYIV